VISAIFRNKRQNAFEGILSFDRVVRPFGYLTKNMCLNAMDLKTFSGIMKKSK